MEKKYNPMGKSKLFKALITGNPVFYLYADKDAFLCLQKNAEDGILNNFALSNENGDMKLFYDTHGANTSLVDFGSDKHEKIEVKKLDSLKISSHIFLAL